MTLGEYISKYRAEHGNMSLRSFAKLADLSVTYVSNIEKGKNNDGNLLSPTISTYMKIAEATGVTLSDLLSDVDDTVTVNSGLSAEEQQLIWNYRDSSEEIRLAAFTMLHNSASAKRKNEGSTVSSAG